jgi:drug/metabolite transporter (DMT)-like permease
VLVYFLPETTIPKSAIGMGLALFTMIANSIAAVMGRGVNRSQRLDPMVVTGISMGIGAVGLLGGVMIFQGLPQLDLVDWLLLLIIAGLNTALAFWIWNRTLQSLTAMESSMINNSMLIQITLLAWIFLGESVSLIGLFGLIIAVLGLFLVNWQPAKPNA